MSKSEDEDEITATQPAMSLLLSGVLAYVEVRSGHDNRSRGVKVQLRNLGASIAETFTNDVTHVVFNEGLPSTYKKAQKLKCHLVSVLWIEACKEQLTKVSEAAYPPIGKQIYDNPRSLKNFKKLKSMQPDFDDEVDALKTEKVLKLIKRQAQKAKPTLKLADSNLEELSKPAHSNQKKTVKRGRKRSAISTGSKKKMALCEITPEVVNKDNGSIATELPSAIDAASNSQTSEFLKAGNRSSSLSQEPVSSSSSVIFLGEAVEAGPSTINPKKAEKLRQSNVSRAEFVDGLSQIVFSLSKENEKETCKVSPWRKHPVASASKISKKKPSPTISPRRSPRYTAGSSSSPVVQKKSSMHQKNIGSKKSEVKPKSVAPSSISASCATLHRRHKMLPPPSPGEDFFLLSQEPGDMPTIDEMAKMNRVSIHLGDKKINLSQVVRAYDAVAQGQYKTSSQSSESIYLSCQGNNENDEANEQVNLRSDKFEDSVSNINDSMMYNAEDVACDAEIARHCENRSDTESSVSSFSTKVLINGMSTKSGKVTKTSSALPGSEGMDCEDVSHKVNADVASENICEREPSPIFVIKKSKLRRPFKKFSGGSKLLSSGHKNPEKDEVKASSHDQEDVVLNLPEQKRSSLNPIDYINKLFLPKFLTPAAKEVVFIEETPDVPCSSGAETERIVIPPTPFENCPEPGVNQCDASSSPSLTSSVLSWVKKSCKVPLFSSRTSSRVSDSISADDTPKVLTSSPSEKYNTSQKTDCPVTPSGPKSVIIQKCRSEMSSYVPPKQSPSLSLTRKEKVSAPQPSTRKSKRYLNHIDTAHVTEVKASSHNESEDGGTSKCSRRKRAQVVVSIEKNKDVENSDSMRGKEDLSPKSLPIIVLQKSEDVHSSSGYDTSHSNHCIIDEGKCSLSCKPNVKRKKAVPSLSPSKLEAKKRSDVYDSDKASTEGESHGIEEPPTRKSGRKRAQTAQSLDCKKARLVESSPENKRSHLSRADSKRRTESQSFEGAKPPGRKSSEEAKKRLTKSLTRAQASDGPKVIVCTFLTASEQNGIDIAGNSLPGWKHEDKVTSRTTHVINSGPKRTLNMLKGMVRGCWIVDQRWMLDSAKSGTWLLEEKYELLGFSPAVKQCRIKRQLLGKEFKHTLFSKAGPIFVSPKTEAPPAKDLKELLELCSADLRTSPVDCKVVVGVNLNHKGNFKCVTPLWVLDCITKNKILSLNSSNYQIE